MEDSFLTRMASLREEVEDLLRKVAEERENADFFSHERIHMDMAVRSLESTVWSLSQTKTGHVLGPDWGRKEAVNA